MGILLLGVAYNDFQPVVDDQLLEGRFFGIWPQGPLVIMENVKFPTYGKGLRRDATVDATERPSCSGKLSGEIVNVNLSASGLELGGLWMFSNKIKLKRFGI